MTTRHYYAMHTPDGDAVNSNYAPIGEVKMFDSKRERDTWVAENAYDARTGKAGQTRTITEHEARVIMLRQQRHEMYEAYELDQSHTTAYTYREYAQYYPTARMHDDYETALGYRY